MGILAWCKVKQETAEDGKEAYTTFSCTTSGKINSINPPSEGFTFRKTNET